MAGSTGDLMRLWFWPIEAMRVQAQLGRTILDAQQVVLARLPMIAAAFYQPFDADYRELTKMVTEKADAFGESGRKMARARGTVHRALGGNARDFGRLTGGDLLGPLDWWRVYGRTLAAMAAMAALPGEALAPVHRGVTANARRLGRTRRG